MATHDKSSESFVIFNNQDNYLNVYEPTNSERNTEKFFAESSKINEVNATEIQPMEITKTSIYKQQNMIKLLHNNLLTDERKKEISFYQQGDDTEKNDEVFSAIFKIDVNSDFDSTNENESLYFKQSQKETKETEIKDPGLKVGNHHQNYKENENKSMKAGTFPKMSISDVEKNKLVKNIFIIINENSTKNTPTQKENKNEYPNSIKKNNMLGNKRKRFKEENKTKNDSSKKEKKNETLSKEKGSNANFENENNNDSLDTILSEITTGISKNLPGLAEYINNHKPSQKETNTIEIDETEENNIENHQMASKTCLKKENDTKKVQKKLERLKKYLKKYKEKEKDDRLDNLYYVVKTWTANSFVEDFKNKDVNKKYSINKIKIQHLKTAEEINFWDSNFKTFVTKNDGRKEENDELGNLRKTPKINYLKEKLDVNKFLYDDIKKRIISYQKKKCRNKLKELYKAQNYKGLEILLKYIKLDGFIRILYLYNFKDAININKLNANNNFNLSLTQQEIDRIIKRCLKLAYIAESPLSYLYKRQKRENKRAKK